MIKHLTGLRCLLRILNLQMETRNNTQEPASWESKHKTASNCLIQEHRYSAAAFSLIRLFCRHDWSLHLPRWHVACVKVAFITKMPFFPFLLKASLRRCVYSFKLQDSIKNNDIPSICGCESLPEYYFLFTRRKIQELPLKGKKKGSPKGEKKYVKHSLIPAILSNWNSSSFQIHQELSKTCNASDIFPANVNYYFC